MAVLDIRQRTGWLFMAVIVGHILLISAQVNTQRGVPLLEEVTFGTFAEVQRAATSAIATVRDNWTNYVALQDVRAENARLKEENAALQVGLQQERALEAVLPIDGDDPPTELDAMGEPDSPWPGKRLQRLRDAREERRLLGLARGHGREQRDVPRVRVHQALLQSKALVQG